MPTSLKVSPYVLVMYLRKAVVHCRVVTLSVSESQNGTNVFSSSQHKRILFLYDSANNADDFERCSPVYLIISHQSLRILW